jgi:DivIVA domain-containing protein
MALTAQDVRAKQFRVTRWRKGYERSEVMALLAFAATALDQLAAGHSPSPPLDGEQVRTATFGSTLLREGYDQGEVDDFLEALASILDALAAAPDSRRS